ILPQVPEQDFEKWLPYFDGVIQIWVQAHNTEIIEQEQQNQTSEGQVETAFLIPNSIEIPSSMGSVSAAQDELPCGKTQEQQEGGLLVIEHKLRTNRRGHCPCG